MKTVQQLRQEGYKIRIQHLRYLHVLGTPTHMVPERDFRKAGRGRDLNGRGGATEMEITEPGGYPVKVFSRCSTQDNFCRKRGVQIALYRYFGRHTRAERVMKQQQDKFAEHGA